MRKYSGPFATKTEAWTEAQQLNDEQRRNISDESLLLIVDRAGTLEPGSSFSIE